MKMKWIFTQTKTPHACKLKLELIKNDILQVKL